MAARCRDYRSLGWLRRRRHKGFAVVVPRQRDLFDELTRGQAWWHRVKATARDRVHALARLGITARIVELGVLTPKPEHARKGHLPPRPPTAAGLDRACAAWWAAASARAAEPPQRAYAAELVADGVVRGPCGQLAAAAAAEAELMRMLARLGPGGQHEWNGRRFKLITVRRRRRSRVRISAVPLEG